MPSCDKMLWMSLDPQQIQAISDSNESVAEKRFRKMGLQVLRLDRQGPRSRPEFLVSDSSGPLLLSEVKTIVSAGYLSNRNAHASTLDSDLPGTESFGMAIDMREDVLANAVWKYRCTVSDIPGLVGIPFAVVLFQDFYADHFTLFPPRMDSFPEISGLLKVVKDDARDQAMRKMSMEELRRRGATGCMKGLPPSRKEFCLIKNECAANPLPGHIVARCLVIR